MQVCEDCWAVTASALVSLGTLTVTLSPSVFLGALGVAPHSLAASHPCIS